MSATCSYRIREAHGEERYCRQPAQWFVEFINPAQQEGGWRTKGVAARCSAHTADKFFPKGTTGITTSPLAHRGVPT